MHSEAYRQIEETLRAGRTLLLDGATGTELERRDAPMHDDAWCAMASVTAPELLREVHADYMRAGARVITANTFSTSRIMLEPAGLGDRFWELNREAVTAAREARDRAGLTDQVVVAGSMSHQIPFIPGTDQRDVRAVPNADTAEAHFREMAEVLAGSGVDLLLLEMMSDPVLVNPAVRAALSTGLPVWVGFSVTGNDAGEPVSYTRAELSFDAVLAQVPLDGVDAAGIMHTKAHVVGPALEVLKAHWTGPLLAYPDSGYFTMPHWNFTDVIPIEDLVRHGREWVQSGVQMVGGCCGLGVEHIMGLRDGL